jgi:hypothetical protein
VLPFMVHNIRQLHHWAVDQLSAFHQPSHQSGVFKLMGKNNFWIADPPGFERACWHHKCFG